MDGWMDRWTDGQTGRQMDKSMGGLLAEEDDT